MPTTQEEIDQERARVDALREEIAQEKAAKVVASAEASKTFEKETLQQQRQSLEAELAALRGEPSPVPVPTVRTSEGDYIVPMGTVSVDTDVVSLDAESVENAVPVEGTVEPTEPSEPSDDGFHFDADDGDLN